MNLERQRLAESIFKDMLTLEESARETALRSRCGGDAELLGEVRSLLSFAGESMAEGPLDRSAPAMLGLPTTPEAQVFRPGYRVGGYEVVSLLGIGGMGVVYRAEQLRPRRSVALKVIRPGLATPSVLKRFEYEAELLGRLDHPGIARIIEAGTAPTEFGVLPFFAMELVDGKPLTKHFAESGGTVRDKVRMIAQVADAVEHAHQRGVIHRDLKPGNILVESAGTAKILDFGVARATGGKEAEQRLTLLRTGDRQLVGTLAYMSPEQVAGDARDVDTRSDVYSLGVVLFELLSGRLPHAVNERSLPDAVRMIRDDEPLRLSGILPALRGDLDTILGKTLSKDPAGRYQSAAELAADLRRYLDNAPILARPPSAAYQLRKLAARHRAIVGAAAAAVVCLAAGLAVSLYLWRDAENARALGEIERGNAVRARNEAQVAQRAAEEEAARQRVLVSFYHDRILTQAFWSGPSTAIVDALEDAVDPKMMRFRGDALNEGRMLYSAAQIFAPCYNLRKSFECLERAVPLLESLPNPPAQELLDIRMFWANQLSKNGDARRALEVNAANALVAERMPDPARARRAVQLADGIAYWMLGKYDRAAEQLLAFRTATKAVPGARPMTVFVATNRIAPMLAEMGNLDEAQAYWDELIDWQDRFTGPNPEMSQFLDYASIMYEQLGDWDRAARERKRQIRCLERTPESTRDALLKARTTLVRELLKRGGPGATEEALAASAELVESARRLGDEFPGAASDAYACRLAALAAAGQAEGFAALRPEAEAFADRVALQPYEILEIRIELAAAALRSGNSTQASHLAEAEHERRVRIKGRPAPQTLEALRVRCAALAAAGRADEARAVGEREIEARRSETGLDDFYSIALLEAVADTAQDRGDLADAERLMSWAHRTSERATGWWTKRSLELRVRLAEVRAAGGRPDSARGLLEEGIGLCRTEFGDLTPPHPRTKILLDAARRLGASWAPHGAPAAPPAPPGR